MIPSTPQATAPDPVAQNRSAQEGLFHRIAILESHPDELILAWYTRDNLFLHPLRGCGSRIDRIEFHLMTDFSIIRQRV